MLCKAIIAVPNMEPSWLDDLLIYVLLCFQRLQKSNPLSEEERPTSTAGVGKSKQSIFQERLRVEHESFKAVFDRRKQRIGGLDSEE